MGPSILLLFTMSNNNRQTNWTPTSCRLSAPGNSTPKTRHPTTDAKTPASPHQPHPATNRARQTPWWS